MQAVPTLGGQRIVTQRLVARGAPHLGPDVVVVEQHLLRFECSQHCGATREDASTMGPVPAYVLIAVEPREYSFFDSRRHRRLREALVVEGEVIDKVLGVGATHARDAVAHDHSHLVSKCGVVGA